MYEAMATVLGTVVTHPVRRELNTGEQVLTFRLASNSRRFDQAGERWVNNGTLFLTVSCWRQLVHGVDASIRRGDPVVVHGQLRSHEYRTREGVERRDLEMRASAVGPDLARCVVRVVRPSDAGTGAVSGGAISSDGGGVGVGQGPGKTDAIVAPGATRSAEPGVDGMRMSG